MSIPNNGSRQPPRTDGGQAEFQKVVQELSVIAIKLDKVMLAGQTITVNIPSGNLIDLSGKVTKSQIIITKPSMHFMVDVLKG